MIHFDHFINRDRLIINGQVQDVIEEEYLPLGKAKGYYYKHKDPEVERITIITVTDRDTMPLEAI